MTWSIVCNAEQFVYYSYLRGEQYFRERIVYLYGVYVGLPTSAASTTPPCYLITECVYRPPLPLLRGTYSLWETPDAIHQSPRLGRVDYGARSRSAFYRVHAEPAGEKAPQSTAATAEFGCRGSPREYETWAKIAQGGSGGGGIGAYPQRIDSGYSSEAGVRSTESPYAGAVIGYNPVTELAPPTRGECSGTAPTGCVYSIQSFFALSCVRSAPGTDEHAALCSVLSVV